MTQRILDEHGGERNKKVFSLNEFEGHRYLEIEQYYLDRKSTEWKKKKGVSLNRDTYRVLKEVVQRYDQEIMDWIGLGYVPEEVARYEEVQEKAAIDNRYRAGALRVDHYEEPRDTRFFEFDHEGGEDRLKMNLAHPMARALAGHDASLQRLVGQVLQAYERAKIMLAGAPAFDSDTLFMHLEQDWSRYLRDALNE